MNNKDVNDEEIESLDNNNKHKRNKIFHNQIHRSDKNYKKFISIFIGYLDTVVILNIFFIITSLTIVGIGPSIISITKSYLLISENKIEKRYRTYFKNFKKYFNPLTVFFGIIVTGLLAGLFYLFIFFYINTPTSTYLVIPWILDVFLILFIVNYSSYFSLMYLKMDLDSKTILKNSLYLSIGGIKNNIFCSLSFIIIFVIPLIFIIQTFILFVVLVFSTTILACTFSVYSLIDKYVIYPYDKEKEMIDKPTTSEDKFEVDISNTKNTTKDSEPLSSDTNYDYDDNSNPL